LCGEKRADRRTTTPELARPRGRLAGADVAGVGADAREQQEARLQAAAEVFDAAEPQRAPCDAVTPHAVLVVPATHHILLDIAAVEVDGTVQGDRRLSRRDARISAQYSESEQRFFHCNYLLG